MQSIKVSGQDFRQLVSEVTKFPGLGMFGESDVVSLQCSDGFLTASLSGMVLAISRKRCSGELPLCGVDERRLGNFAGIVSEGSEVTITPEKNRIYLKCRKNVMDFEVLAGTNHFNNAPLLPTDKIKLDGASAERVKYLAEVAYNDMTRAELCCVMLSDGKAVALDQACCAVLPVKVEAEGHIPLPLVLAKAVTAGTSIYAGAKTTALRSGCTVYSVPAMSKAKTEYPLGMVRKLQKQTGDVLVTVAGEKLAGALDTCIKCMGQLARTETVVQLKFVDGLLTLTAKNGGAKFSTTLKATHDKPEVFRLPLSALGRVRPFLAGKMRLAGNAYNDLYFLMEDGGWCMFSGEVTKA